MKKQPEITVRIPEDIMRKFLYISNAENRTPNNQILLMLRNNIQYFERTHGKLSADKLRDIDLTEYISEEGSENE